MKKNQFVGLEDTAAGEIHTAARWDSSTKLTSLRPGVAAMFWICYHDELRNLIHSKNCNPLSRLAALAAYNVFIAVIIIKTVNPTNSMSLTWGCGGWRSLGVASAQVSRRPPPRTAWVQGCRGDHLHGRRECKAACWDTSRSRQHEWDLFCECRIPFWNQSLVSARRRRFLKNLNPRSRINHWHYEALKLRRLPWTRSGPRIEQRTLSGDVTRLQECSMRSAWLTCLPCTRRECPSAAFARTILQRNIYIYIYIYIYVAAMNASNAMQ